MSSFAESAAAYAQAEVARIEREFTAARRSTGRQTDASFSTRSGDRDAGVTLDALAHDVERTTTVRSSGGEGGTGTATAVLESISDILSGTRDGGRRREGTAGAATAGGRSVGLVHTPLGFGDGAEPPLPPPPAAVNTSVMDSVGRGRHTVSEFGTATRTTYTASHAHTHRAFGERDLGATATAASVGTRRADVPAPTYADVSLQSYLDASAATEGSASTQNSRSVMMALRTLQDKIRKLEEQNRVLASECEHLRQQHHEVPHTPAPASTHTHPNGRTHRPRPLHVPAVVSVDVSVRACRRW